MPAASAPSSPPRCVPPATRSSPSPASPTPLARRVADAAARRPVGKPTAVARACDLLLLTVPDDMLDNVVTMLAASGAIRAGQYVVHTSGRHGLAVLEPGAAAVGARAVAMHPAMTFTGTARRPRPACPAASSA